MFRQERNAFRKDTTITLGSLKHLSSAQIVDTLDKLTPDPKRPGYFVGYGETHNWTYKCSLWEVLYKSAFILMQNFDVTDQECNMGESIISTCMGFLGKTKDSRKARRDLVELCNRPSLELKVIGGKPQTLQFVLKLNRGKKSCDG
jgi:hypothetical protein